jgi:2-dehydro-3-deoxygluconokinase
LTGLLWTEGTLLQAPVIDIPDVIDPVGVGDAFMGAWLHAISLFPDDKQKQLNYSLAAAALKNTIPGDFNISTEDEILDVMEQRYDTSTLYKHIS